jgi:hypothetical protein
MINKDGRHERELRVELYRLVVETQLGHLWNVSFLNLSTPL